MNDNKNTNDNGSSMVMLMKDLYMSPVPHHDFTYGYPERINPEWISKLQTSVPAEIFQNDTIARTFIGKIENYFLTLFKSTNVSLTTTAGYAIACMCDALIREPGDEIIIQDVSFEPYPKLIESYKGKVVVAAKEPDFSMSISNIKNVYTEKTKAIIIVNPDNPTGLIYSESEMKELVSFCIEKNITLVVDHTFFQITPFGKQVTLFTTFPESKQLSYVIIGDTGKILGLKGSKFGALIYPEKLVGLFNEILSNYFFQDEQYDLYLISSIVSDDKFNEYLNYLNKVIADNYEYLKNNLNANLKLLPLEATVFCLIDITATGLTDDAAVHSLLEKGIGVIPITDFYYNKNDSPKNLIRVSLSRPLTEIKKFAEVINQLKDQVN